MRALVLVTAFAPALSAGHYTAPAGNRVANTQGESIVLPGGRLLTPLGRQYFTGPGAFGLAMSPDGRMLATADGGPRRYSVTLLRRNSDQWETQELRTRAAGADAPGDDDDWQSVFMGLAFVDDKTLIASEGNSGRIRIVSVDNPKSAQTISLNHGPFRHSFSGDLAVDRARNLAIVADQAHFRVVLVHISSRKVVSSVRVGRLPFAVALSPDGKRAYVTNLGMFEYQPIPGANAKDARASGLPFPAFGFPSREAERGARRETGAGRTVDVPGLGKANAPEANSLAVVDIADAANPKLLTFIPTGLPFGARSLGGSSPSGVLATAEKIFVSNAHNDTITVIGARTLKVDRTISLRIQSFESLRGVLPVGMAWQENTGRLLVAEAGINAVALINPETGRVISHLPAGWFPTRVITRDEWIYVSNAKGHGTGPNAGLERSFQGEIRRGTVSVIPAPNSAEVNTATAAMYRNNGFEELSGNPGVFPKEIRHVVLIVKENRTFDEVFGDIAADRRPARYGNHVTPNHHEVARRWAMSDNFYADSEVSVDGHHWLVGTYPNAWVETSRMQGGPNKDFRLAAGAPGRLHFPESNSSLHPEGQLEAGALWHHLERNKITFRNFGEGFELAGVNEGAGLKPTGARLLTNVPMPEPLYRNTSRTYPQYNMNIPDQFRATQLIKELTGLRALPRFVFVHLPNDHTSKPRPKDGYPTEAAFVADNDYALGRILEYLSRRPEWKQMAVLITEDDAAGGVDHIDSHRTLMLIASPWARRGHVSRLNSSFPGLMKTIFRLLNLPPLNLYDAAAADLSDCFTDSPDFTPFELQPIPKDVFDPAAAREPLDPQPSDRMDDPRILRDQHRRR